MKRLVVAVIGLLLALPVMAMSVVFLNPGKSDEAFWLISARAMQQAAKSLDVQLEVLFAERQPLRTLELARGIIQELARLSGATCRRCRLSDCQKAD